MRCINHNDFMPILYYLFQSEKVFESVYVLRFRFQFSLYSIQVGKYRLIESPKVSDKPGHRYPSGSSLDILKSWSSCWVASARNQSWLPGLFRRTSNPSAQGCSCAVRRRWPQAFPGNRSPQVPKQTLKRGFHGVLMPGPGCLRKIPVPESCPEISVVFPVSKLWK